MPSTAHGLTYPDATGNVHLWEHIQTLATTAETAIAANSDGHLPITSSLLNKRVHRADFTGATATDASGFLTVTHGAGFTPTFAQASIRLPSGSFALFIGADTFTGTTARLRFANWGVSGAFISTAPGIFTAIFWE